jgi:outer membrane putative beta-barrel porin/alpha-amylase
MIAVSGTLPEEASVRGRIVQVIAVISALTFAGSAFGGQPLETESTRLLRARQFEFEMGVEHQRASAGTESALPMAIGYGISDRAELLVEPVLLDRVRDKGVPGVGGVGDLELTLTTRLYGNEASRSGFALAGEVKVPTARNRRIGSGQTDFTLWSIAGHQLGRWDTHLNLGYTLIGRPPGVAVNNVFNYGLAEEYRLNPTWELLAEVFGNTSALAEAADQASGTGESALTPEIGGAETVGTLGARFHTAHGLTYSLGLSYDSQQAVLVHPGLSFRF